MQLDQVLLQSAMLCINSYVQGSIDTPLLHGVVSPEMLENVRQGIILIIPPCTSNNHADTPMGREGSAQEVANLIVWLLSDFATFCTGTNIPIDGGRLA